MLHALGLTMMSPWGLTITVLPARLNMVTNLPDLATAGGAEPAGRVRHTGTPHRQPTDLQSRRPSNPESPQHTSRDTHSLAFPIPTQVLIVDDRPAVWHSLRVLAGKGVVAGARRAVCVAAEADGALQRLVSGSSSSFGSGATATSIGRGAVAVGSVRRGRCCCCCTATMEAAAVSHREAPLWELPGQVPSAQHADRTPQAVAGD